MSSDLYFPIRLSLEVAMLALAVAGPAGIALAWLQARYDYRLKTVVDALILLPLVLPPSVVGFVLVVVFGRNGPLGALLFDTWGIRLVFSQWAAVIASATVALPLVVKTAQPALEAIPQELEDIARSLGLGRVGIFFRVALPIAWRAVAAAMVLGFARAVGEFGATLMFAGNLPGRTNTVALEIYSSFQAGHDQRALFYVTVMSVLSCAIVLVASRLSRTTEAS